MMTGNVDRVELGKLVFKDVLIRRRLNAATHLPVALDLFKKIFIHWISGTAILASQHALPMVINLL